MKGLKIGADLRFWASDFLLVFEWISRREIPGVIVVMSVGGVAPYQWWVSHVAAKFLVFTRNVISHGSNCFSESLACWRFRRPGFWAP